MKNKIINLIKDGFFHIMGGSVLIKLMGFISSIIIVRLVTKEEYGCLAYADNLYSYISIVAGLGMATGILIKCRADADLKTNIDYFKYAITRGSAIQLIGAIIILIYYLFFINEFRNARTLMILLVLYPLSSYLIQCCTNYIRAYQENKLYSRAAVIQSVILLLFSIVLGYLMSINGIVIARYLGCLALIIILIPFIKKHFTWKSCSLSIKEKKNFIFLSISLLISSFFSELMYSNEMLLVNKLISNETITADYKIATLIPSQIFFVTQSLLIYFIPKFVQYKDKKTHLWRYSLKVGAFNGVIIIICCIIAILITPFLVSFLYGDKYSNTIGLSIAFWIAYSLNAVLRMIPVNVLAATGHEKENAILSVLGCGIHFVVAWFVLKNSNNIVLLPIAIGIVYILVGIISWGYLYLNCKEKGVNYEEKN